ncbi:MAG: TIGR00282 family metallophosphoesterase [Clostridia bacterium]|nr:TIGR00282 family metallophosphoesterase [Clostridia bacterium]
MKILAVGDLIGSAGIRKLKSELPKIREQEKIDFVIVNGENSAEGMGITEKNFKDILEEKVDVITMGNHTWGKKEIFQFINHPKLIRPANYPKGVVGKGYNIYSCKNKKIAVINLIGRVDINVLSENPFLLAKEIVQKIQNQVDIIIIDFHAEATAEKIALGYFLDGKVTAVYGTHTHVQTADETILEGGTAYITDIGMTGPKKSVIGMEVAASIKRFETTLPERYKIATGECILNGVIFDIDDNTNQVKEIKRVNLS